MAATATPITSASEQQQNDDDNQDQFHGEPPFRECVATLPLPKDAPLCIWLILFNARTVKSFRCCGIIAIRRVCRQETDVEVHRSTLSSGRRCSGQAAALEVFSVVNGQEIVA
jgi:hypothetical protein